MYCSSGRKLAAGFVATSVLEIREQGSRLQVLGGQVGGRNQVEGKTPSSPDQLDDLRRCLLVVLPHLRTLLDHTVPLEY